MGSRGPGDRRMYLFACVLCSCIFCLEMGTCKACTNLALTLTNLLLLGFLVLSPLHPIIASFDFIYLLITYPCSLLESGFDYADPPFS